MLAVRNGAWPFAEFTPREEPVKVGSKDGRSELDEQFNVQMLSSPEFGRTLVFGVPSASDDLHCNCRPLIPFGGKAHGQPPTCLGI